MPRYINMDTLIKKAGVFIHKNAPTILSVISAGGVIVTAALSGKAAKKALSYDVYGMLSLKEDYDKNKKQHLKEKIKMYAPAIITGTATIACIFAANILNKRSQAALTSALFSVEQAYRDYQRKNIELHGEEAHNDILKAIEVEKTKDMCIDGLVICGSSNLVPYDENCEKCLFHDVFSNRYFESTLNKVLEAEYHLNRNFAIMGAVPVSMFYDMLGLEPKKEYDDLYFGLESGLRWIDFNNQKVILDDGLECYVINMIFEPTEEG